MFSLEFKKIDFGFFVITVWALFIGLIISRTLNLLTNPLGNLYVDELTPTSFFFLRWAWSISCVTVCLISYLALFYLLKKPSAKKPLTFLLYSFLAVNLSVAITGLLTESYQPEPFQTNDYGKGLWIVYILGINIISLIGSIFFLLLEYIVQRIFTPQNLR